MNAQAQPSGGPGRIEIALAALTIALFSEAFLPKLFAPPPEAMATDEDSFLRYLWLPFYALIGAGLFLAWRRAGQALLRSPLLLLLLVWTFASTAWSMFPGITSRRALAVAFTSLLGVYLAARYDWRGGLRLLGGVWFAILALTLVSGLVVPGFAVMSVEHTGAWAGGWWEKNQLGGHAARASFLFLFLAWRDAPWRKAWLAAFALGALLVALSTSATALLGLMVGCVFVGLSWQMVKGRGRSLLLLWMCAAGGSLGAILYLAAPELLLAMLGKEPTLTGRTDIWRELIRATSARPWLGYGYQAFWAPLSEPRYWLRQAVDWEAPTGHNGWLDLAASLGLVGVAIFALDLMLAIGRSVRLSLASPAGVFALGSLAQFVLFSMSESIILWQNSIIWATYVFVSVRLALDASAAQSISPQSRAAPVGAVSIAPMSTARRASSASVEGRTP